MRDDIYYSDEETFNEVKQKSKKEAIRSTKRSQNKRKKDKSGKEPPKIPISAKVDKEILQLLISKNNEVSSTVSCLEEISHMHNISKNRLINRLKKLHSLKRIEKNEIVKMGLVK